MFTFLFPLISLEVVWATLDDSDPVPEEAPEDGADEVPDEEDDELVVGEGRGLHGEYVSGVVAPAGTVPL